MTQQDIAQILAAVAEVKTEVRNLAKADDRAATVSDKQSTRLDKLERIAYVAIGLALASGASDLVSLIP
jgi:hypothetical protein